MKNSSETVWVIILNYITYQDTIEYCENLSKQTKINLNILIVDNCSPNDSYDKLVKYSESNTESIDIIKTNFNGGYASGNNFGLKYLISKGFFGHVIISNNDINILDNELICKLIQSYNQLDKVAFIAPLMVDRNNNINYSAWNIPTFNMALKNSSKLFRKLFNSGKYYDLKKVQKLDCLKVDVLAGSFILSKIPVFELINFFDENTFLYGEENILAWKIKNIKLTNYLDLNLKYFHSQSKTVTALFSKIEQMKMIHKSLKYFLYNYEKIPKIKLLILDCLFYLCLIEYLIIQKIKYQKVDKLNHAIKI